jgi:hypothetical protein
MNKVNKLLKALGENTLLVKNTYWENNAFHGIGNAYNKRWLGNIVPADVLKLSVKQAIEIIATLSEGGIFYDKFPNRIETPNYGDKWGRLANYIEINGGDISVLAFDDGINVSGGNDQSAMGGRDNFSNVNTGNRKLVINGGKLYVNADGDGLDANGSIELNNGEVIVPGTTSNGNGALDYDSSFTVNGGSMIYYGATGMWQNPSNSSKQYSICFGVSGKAGDEIVLKDSNGNAVASIKTEKTYGAVAISNSSLKQGETYTLYINGTASGSQTISSIVTSNLTTGGMNGGNNVNRGAQNRQSM